MEPLHLAIAVGPLAIYFLLLGVVNLSRRPWLTTGARDFAALGAAVSGLAAVGPVELFVPEQAMARGPFAWVLILALYVLSVMLLALLMRPRLVIYNITLEQLRPVLGETAAALDKEARWAGASLALPHLGVSLYVETSPAMRNVQLVAAGPRQNYAGWRHLEVALRKGLRQTAVAPNPLGASLILFGAAMIALAAYRTISEPQAVAAALREMLRL
jgi:hypothetical protein